MHLFANMDEGPQYLFDWVAKTHEPLLPVFSAGCLLSSPWAASIVVLLACFLLYRQGLVRTALLAAGCFVLAGIIVEGVRLLMRRPPSGFGATWIGHPGFFTGDLRNQYSSFPSASLFLSTFAWISLVFATGCLRWRRPARIAIILLAMLTVFGGFLCHLILSQHYLSDLLAGLAGGGGTALLAWSFDQPATQAS